MSERVRPYLYYDVALSICSRCYRKVEGKIVFQDGDVLLLKRCPEHGGERVLIADDVEYWRRARETFLKPSDMPARFNTPVRWGCPFDCGLCADHEQHSCLSLVEIGERCNLECPVCYASSGPARGSWRSLEEVGAMLDAVVRNELHPDVVQISGGEPTLHPEFFAVLDLARKRPIRHLMVNTNGVRIAREPDFARRLADYAPGFEVYLQFDSFERDVLLELRGVDLRAQREKALEALDRHGVSTTLVVTLKKGSNDREIGRILDYATKIPCVRGVTFQPIQDAGRNVGFDPARDRLTLTGVRRAILEQSDLFRPADVLPVPCHPDSIAMAYALKIEGRVVPLTGLVDPRTLIESTRNTIVLEQEPALRAKLFELFSTDQSPERGASTLRELLCCMPRVDAPPSIDYRQLFRVIVLQFQDAHSFDVRSVKKSCVHVVHPRDGRLIPFETYNLFYRDGLEESRLAPLRAAVEVEERALAAGGFA